MTKRALTWQTSLLMVMMMLLPTAPTFALSTLLQMMMVLLARAMRKIPRHRLLDLRGLQDLHHHHYRLHQQFRLGLQWLSHQCLRQLFHLSDLAGAADDEVPEPPAADPAPRRAPRADRYPRVAHPLGPGPFGFHGLRLVQNDELRWYDITASCGFHHKCQKKASLNKRPIGFLWAWLSCAEHDSLVSQNQHLKADLCTPHDVACCCTNGVLIAGR